jgi:chemotaxis protein methyltransferase CheR
MREHNDTLSSRDYARLCDLIYAEAGIHLGSERRTMLESRIKRRLRALEIPNFDQYCKYLFTPEPRSEEIVPLIDVVTTNKTDFFREPRHFDFLFEQVLPKATRTSESRPFTVWSAGCSSGEEPYTLAILLSEYRQRHPGFRFRVLATDISTAMLSRAECGIYSAELAEQVPEVLRRKYFLRSRNPQAGRVRVVPELRSAISFRRLNLLEDEFDIDDSFDVIFLRNVMIYFDRGTKVRILNRLAGHLCSHGFLFVGHAETLHGLVVPFTPVAPSTYRKSHA